MKSVNLMALCSEATRAYDAAEASFNEQDDDDNITLHANANAILDEIIATRPINQAELRAKATTMFRMGYQPDGGLSDRVVRCLLRDIGVPEADVVALD